MTRTIEHGGMCAGGQPVNADGVIPGPPELSSNLRIRTGPGTNYRQAGTLSAIWSPHNRSAALRNLFAMAREMRRSN